MGIVSRVLLKIMGRAKYDEMVMKKKAMDKSHYAGLSVEDTFTAIYKNNDWGSSESVSGVGSEVIQTQELIRLLPSLFKQYSIKSLIDVPCGDFNWMQRVSLDGIKYTGGDIVKDLVEKNNRKYASENINFQQINLLNDPLPQGDIIHTRDCLVHFSYNDIIKAINNIKKSGIQYILTTTYTDRVKNYDITTGDWRALNLELPPFNFPKPLSVILENCTEGKTMNKDKSLALWKISDLPDLSPL